MFHIKWAPVLNAQELQQASNPAAANQPEAIPWFLYDTQQYVSTTTTSLTFFQTVQTDKTLGNMESAGQLPDPQYFIIHYVTCDILDAPINSTSTNGAAALGPVNDIELLLKAGRGTFTFQISNKNYGPFPLTLCQATGGATGFGAATFTASQSAWFGNNGIPGSGGFPFLGAIVIPPKVGFNITLQWTSAQTLSASQQIRMGLAGVLYRRVI